MQRLNSISQNRPTLLRNRSYRTLCILLVFLLSALGGCTQFPPRVYKIQVNQGNVVKPSMLSQLKPGMTRKQVLYVLGTPLVQDPFDVNRWDYLYEERQGRTVHKHYHLKVFFEGDRLLRYEGETPKEEEQLFEAANKNR